MYNNYILEKSNKFKTNFLTVRFMLDAKKEYATISALLSIYLVYVNNIHKDFSSATKYLQELYSTRFDINTTIKGDKLCFDFMTSFIASKYLNDKDYIEKVMNEFLAYIYDPLLVDGTFDQENFDIRKFDLESRIKSTYDDKGSYAYEAFAKLFGQGKPFAINMGGYLEDLKDITKEDLLEFYHLLINQVPVVSGMFDEKDYDQVLSLLQAKIPSQDKDVYLDFYKIDSVDPYREVIESQDIVQSKFYMGFNIDNTLIFDDHASKLVFSSLFGLSSNSFLFKIVREQENLCYTIRANYDFYSNTVSVMAGIDKSNFEKTKDLVIKIKDKIIAGDFSDEEFEDAKTVLIDMYEKQKDSQENSTFYRMNRTMCDLIPDLNKDIASIKAVTREDVLRVGKKLHLNTVYLLSGDKNE